MVKTEIDIQIRFADVDRLGHVNNVNVQHYFDLGKSDYYEKVLELHHVDGRGTGVITAATETSYLAQIRPDDKIFVETWAEKAGNKSMVLFQRILSREDGKLCCESRSVMVGFDFCNQVTIPIEEEWRRKMGL
jgi:Predicted thioesterase